MKKALTLALSMLLLFSYGMAETTPFLDFSYAIPTGYEVEYESSSSCSYVKVSDDNEVQLTVEQLDSVRSFDDVLELIMDYSETEEYDTIDSSGITIATFVPEDSEDYQRIASFFVNGRGYWINIYSLEELSKEDYSDWENLLKSIAFNISEQDEDKSSSDDASETGLSISSSTTTVGSKSTTVWYVDGQEFTLKGTQTKTVVTPWGTYEFDAYGNYEKISD